MSLGHQPPEQRLGVAFARTLLVVAAIALLGWFFSGRSGTACSSPRAPVSENPR